MKPGTITHTIAVLLSSVTALFTHAASGATPHSKAKENKKSNSSKKSSSSKTSDLLKVDPITYTPLTPTEMPAPQPGEKFPWKTQIVTTTFWIGEKPTENNPVPNRASSWDGNWTKNYGGLDDPDKSKRRDFIPVKFTPQQNPFYVALPYNDKSINGHRPEAPRVVPWFKEAYQGPGVSTCKGRWIAIRFGNKVAYAQWEDAGPFRTDHWQYVFGNERPKPNLNKGAGLDVSPAVRDYLGMKDTDVTDWRFVEFSEVPHGPWSKHGDNNTFVQNARKGVTTLVEGPKPTPGGVTVHP